MVNSSAIRKQAAPITYHLLAAQQEPCKKKKNKKSNSQRKMFENFPEKSGQWTISKKQNETNKTERARGLDRKENKKKQDRDRKGEPNNSPEISDGWGILIG